MNPQRIPTGLSLDQDDEVPPNTVVVPSLTGPGGFVTTEPMVFRAEGETSTNQDVKLFVQQNPARKSAVVAPSTVAKLASRAGAPISVRRLTSRERLRSYGKAEAILGMIAVLLAIAAIVTAVITPSADKTAGRADLAAQIQPIELRLNNGIRDGNSVAVQQADSQLHTVLATQDESNQTASESLVYITLILGVLSAGIAARVAIKRAKATV